MAQGKRAQAGTFQVSQLQTGIFILPEPLEISSSSKIDFDSSGTSSRDTSYISTGEIEFESVGLLSQDRSILASSNINIDQEVSLSVDQSLVPRKQFEKASQVSVNQVSSGQVGYYEFVYPATSIVIDSEAHLSLRSEMESDTEVELVSEGTIGVDVYIDGETSEVEFTTEGTIGVDRNILTSNQLELVTSGNLELIILFTNESCLVGLVNTESDLVGVDGTESKLVGIIKRCGLE